MLLYTITTIINFKILAKCGFQFCIHNCRNFSISITVHLVRKNIHSSNNNYNNNHAIVFSCRHFRYNMYKVYVNQS